MQESWGAEILDNAKQFDTLFSLYSTPCKTQASSCQLLGVKPDATSLFHMETEMAPSGGVGCSPQPQPSVTPGLLLAHSKGSLQQQKKPLFQWCNCHFQHSACLRLDPGTIRPREHQNRFAPNHIA